MDEPIHIESTLWHGGERGDWEEHLQLLLYLYRTTKHATTGLSMYEVFFGSNSPPLNFPTAGTLLQ